MAYRVQVAGPAERDLDRAVDYLVNVLGAPGAAMSLLDRYEEVLGLLTDNPRLFGVDFDVSEAVGLQVRRCMARGYEIYYLVDDEREVVSVIAFIHGSRDAVPIVGKRI
ncbi:MAG: type II toxin-antitoxin system RelE/ParE family toxin [Coriobacteriales bacterium]|nr:type II toxin-antitoxin system RelE/ParE family toxin [Coriobacteriales bacterium]